MMFVFNIKTKELDVSNVSANIEQTVFAFTSVNFFWGNTFLLNRSLKIYISKPDLWIFVTVSFQLP